MSSTTIEKQLEEQWDSIRYASSFEPTLNPFKNGLLVNYKKVGSRFFGQLLSLPNDVTDNKIQMDLIIQRYPIENHLGSFDSEFYRLKYGHEDRFCYTELDIEQYNPVPRQHPQTYLEYSNSIEFLKYCGVENYNELFFDNKKDIIFLIRNPIHRFFSGIIQILFTILYDISENETLMNEIKFYTRLDTADIINVSKILKGHNPTKNELNSLKKNEIELLISFIVEKQWNLVLQDIHTHNYLFNILEWIYNIKDKSKIKIILLKDCKSNKTLDFFSNLMGNDILYNTKLNHPNESTYWEYMKTQTGSNQSIYKIFIDKLLEFNTSFFYESSVNYYLRNEYGIFEYLVNSPYFLDLSD